MGYQPGIKLEDIMRETILMALKFYGGNRTHTADSLGISLRTLQNKLGQYHEQGHQITPAPNEAPRAEAHKASSRSH